MNNVLIGIFSIPGALLVAAGVVVPLMSARNGGIGAIGLIGYGVILAGVLALAANGYAIRTSSRYKKTSVATLAVVLPWISAIISVGGIFWGLRFVMSV